MLKPKKSSQITFPLFAFVICLNFVLLHTEPHTKLNIFNGFLNVLNYNLVYIFFLLGNVARV